MGNMIDSLLSGFTKVIADIVGKPLDFLSGKTCSSVCGSTWDLICYIDNFCVTNLAKMAAILFLLYLDSGDGSDGVPFEGVEICCFNLDGAHYMIYTPVDPLLFVAVKDKDGVLRIAEDDLMDDPSVVGAIDEETEFTALVEEEEALLESVLGER